MEWSKLKNVILIILLCTNIALLAMVLREQYEYRSTQRQIRADALEFLAREGIEVEPAAVPGENDLPYLKVERDLSEEETLARTLLGEELEMQERGGGVYLYRSPAGEIQFHSDSAFQARLEPDSFPLSGQTPREHAEKLMAALGFAGDVLSGQSRGTETAVLMRQTWQGAPIFNLQVTLNYTKDGLSSITGGRRLFGTPQEQPNNVLTPSSALVRFAAGLNGLGDVCSSIDDIQPGYISSASLADGMILTPVWYITTDTGAYQLDLLTGELSRT